MHLVGAWHGGEPVQDQSLETWRGVTDLNLTSAFLCAHDVLPEMLDGGWGRLVMVWSRTAREGRNGQSAYAVAKEGVATLAEVIADECCGTGVTANTIAVRLAINQAPRTPRAARTKAISAANAAPSSSRSTNPHLVCIAMSVMLMLCIPGIALIIFDSRKSRAKALTITSALAAIPSAAARRAICVFSSVLIPRAGGRTRFRNAAAPMRTRRPMNEKVRASELAIEEASPASSSFSIVVNEAAVPEESVSLSAPAFVAPAFPRRVGPSKTMKLKEPCEG